MKVAPPSVVLKTSSRLTKTVSGCAGSTTRAWLYQDCTPTLYPGWLALVRADPEFCSFVEFASMVQGPAALPLAET